MSNVIEQSTRSTLGLSLTAPSSVNSYTFNTTVAGFSVPTKGIDGTSGADNITAEQTTNYIFGFGGNDTLSAGTVSGLPSAAVLVGGDGADRFVFAGSPATTLTGVLSGAILDFSSVDGDVIDISAAGVSYSQLIFVTNSNGSNVQIQGNGLNIVVAGMPGEVVLSESNVITTGGGSTSNPSTGTTASTSSDNITGTSGDDNIQALAGNDTVNAGDGNDSINGNSGDDSILGGNGSDSLRGGQGNDFLNGNAGADSVFGDLGNDTVRGGQGADLVRGGRDDDLIYADVGSDTAYGDLGNDTIYGGQDNDFLYGGDGNDVLYGDRGNDYLEGGAGIDTFVFRLNHGTDTIADFVSGTDKLQFSSDLFASASAAVSAFSGGAITTASGVITMTAITSISASDIIIG